MLPMENKESVFDALDSVLDQTEYTDFKHISKNTPLVFDVTFYKSFESVKNPSTGKIMNFDVVKCFEFPQFACIFESDFIAANRDEWKEPLLSEFLDYVKIKAESFFKCLSSKRAIWIDDVTARFSLV
jgi:phage terminase large subunit